MPVVSNTDLYDSFRCHLIQKYQLVHANVLTGAKPNHVWGGAASKLQPAESGKYPELRSTPYDVACSLS